MDSNETQNADDSSGDEVQPARSRGMTCLRAIALLAAAWVLGDYGYSRYIAARIDEWEAKVPWTADGLASDASEFTLGTGRTALLMIHGFSDSPQMFRKLAPALASRGYTCRGILLPGFGRNVQAYEDSTADEWLAKVDQEVRALRADYDKVVIVAHSLGGAITINHALNHPQTQDALVLLAPAVRVSDKRSPLFSVRFWHRFSKLALPASKISYTPFEMDAHDPEERERPLRNRFTPRTVVDNTFRLIDANRGRAAELKLPTLFFLSTTDQVIDSAAIEAYYNACGGDPKKLVQLEDSGHMIPVDLQWELVVEEIDVFLRKRYDSVASQSSVAAGNLGTLP